MDSTPASNIYRARWRQAIVLPLIWIMGGLLVGVLLQAWSDPPISRVLRLEQQLGIPLRFILPASIGVMFGVTVLTDRMKHRIVLEAKGISVKESKGRYFIPYQEIEQVGINTARMLGIDLIDFDAWLKTQESAPSYLATARASGQKMGGYDLQYASSVLGTSAKTLVHEIRHRAGIKPPIRETEE